MVPPKAVVQNFLYLVSASVGNHAQGTDLVVVQDEDGPVGICEERNTGFSAGRILSKNDKKKQPRGMAWAVQNPFVQGSA